MLIGFPGTIYRKALFNKAMAKSADCPIQNIEVSSAYINRDPERTADGRSLVNRVKRVGSSTDPCGIPVVTGNRSDVTPFNMVNCILSLK